MNRTVRAAAQGAVSRAMKDWPEIRDAVGKLHERLLGEYCLALDRTCAGPSEPPRREPPRKERRGVR